MLARTYLSAADLGCSERVRDAAIVLLGMMERGEIVERHKRQMDTDQGLDMSIWRDERSCGTMGCLGGWIEYLVGADVGYDVKRLVGWRDLFTPEKWYASRLFPVERCAHALRAKLATGHADWSRWP